MGRDRSGAVSKTTMAGISLVSDAIGTASCSARPSSVAPERLSSNSTVSYTHLMPLARAETAYLRMKSGQAKFRMVLDMEAADAARP